MLRWPLCFAIKRSATCQGGLQKASANNSLCILSTLSVIVRSIHLFSQATACTLLLISKARRISLPICYHDAACCMWMLRHSRHPLSFLVSGFCSTASSCIVAVLIYNPLTSFITFVLCHYRTIRTK